MGLYAIDCGCCGKPFLWFSGNLSQWCFPCQQKTLNQQATTYLERVALVPKAPYVPVMDLHENNEIGY